ncbi:glycosyltransferase [Pectinatus cerevisiiphilus]|uniref:Methionine biosynthesis protein MetW n=2 Tax=Pectinatus cerevisiiphilus TaxID=86956 RepID=A0A4R3K9P3_9FIRM|nr:glycosyltransferase [Pectinatus cerevisiiphilus]TCS79625.1 methionine biosynthesis protein MetW [Pectinatus cerevisiiphilus]
MAVTNLDERKICFIISKSDLSKYKKTVDSLTTLICPKGYEVLVRSFTENNTAAAYNRIMRENDAKYKIYVTAGTEFINENLLAELIDIFRKNWAIGIVGTSGAVVLPTNGISLSAIKRVGKVMMPDGISAWSAIDDTYQKVQLIDSFFLATQYDIKWRDDLFLSEIFAKAGQCVEFKKQYYLTVVAKQPAIPWCKLENLPTAYDETERNLFLNEYAKDIYPLVSILIPTYNRPYFFEKALHSAVTQSYKNIEIIIGDDSTNDDTKKIVEKYQKKYSNIFYQKNKALHCTVRERSYANYNSIFHKSHGAYINYLNDDDLFHPEKISKMMNYYLEYDNIALVSSYRIFINENDEETVFSGYKSLKVNNDIILDAKSAIRTLLLKANNFIGEPTTALVRRIDIDNNFGTFWGTSFHCVNDMAQWLESLKYGDLAYLKEPLSCMRVHKGQKPKDSAIRFAFKNDLFSFYTLSYSHFFGFENEEEFIETIKKWLSTYASENTVFAAKEELKQKTSLFYDKDIIETFLKNYTKAKNIIKGNILQTNIATNNSPVQHMSIFLQELLSNQKGQHICYINEQAELFIRKFKNLNTSLVTYKLQMKTDKIDSTATFLPFMMENKVNLSIKQAANFFDCIVLFDNIMQWRQPENILLELKKILKPNGTIIINFYNVAYYKNIKNVLDGKWHYKAKSNINNNYEANLLSVKNIRFFTIKSMQRMLESVGLKIQNRTRIFTTEPETECATFMDPYMKAGLASRKDLPDFRTCAYIMVISK